MSKLPVDVLQALTGASQLTSDPSMFSALAQLNSLSNNMVSNNNLDDHHLEMATSSRFSKPSISNKQSSSKQQIASSKSSSSSSTNKPSASSSETRNNSSGFKRSRIDDHDAFHQGIDLSMKQRTSQKKSDSRVKASVDSDD